MKEFSRIYLGACLAFSGLVSSIGASGQDDPFRFAVISDIHFENNMGEGAKAKVTRALKTLIDKDIDAMFVVGDLSDYGQKWHYERLLEVFDDKSVVPEEFRKKVYFMMGNHDHYGGTAEDGTNLSYKHYYMLGQPLHQYVILDGYPCITISMNGVGSNDYNEESQQFLREHLEKAAKDYPGKPIFVFSHAPCSNTVYGSKNWGNNKLGPIMEKYPQVIFFAGHSHHPLGDPRSIHQEHFTSVNDGGSTYSELTPGDVSEGIHPANYKMVTEGVIANVDKDMNVEIERWDTYRNEEILPRWEINAPHDGTNFQYKGRTGGARPAFSSGAQVAVTDIKSESCTVTFAQGIDDEVVHHYLIEILQGDKVIASYTKFSEFYLNSDMPKILSVEMKGLPFSSTLKARVYAVDSYEQKSDPIVSAAFNTPAYVPGITSRCPKADLVDIAFKENGSAENRVGNIQIIQKGDKPGFAYNKTYKEWEAQMSGYSYYRVDYKDNNTIKDAFSNGFTFEVLYSPKQQAAMSPMSTQQGGGAGFEQSGNGVLQFFCHVGGSYKTVKTSAPLESNRYYHAIATYSKSEEKIKLYIDGALVDETEAKGNFGFPPEDTQWLAIGGDCWSETDAQYKLNGNLVMARMYSKAVNRDEVFWMSQAVKEGNLPIFSSVEQTVWYRLQFLNGNAVIEDQGAGKEVLTANTNTLSGSQLWKFVGTKENFKLVSQNGNVLDLKDNFFYTSTEGGVELRLVRSENKTFTSSLEIQPISMTGQCMNQYEGSGAGRKLSIYTVNDGNNPLKMIEASPVLPLFSETEAEHWYILRFKSGNAALQDMGTGQRVMTQTFDINNENQLWKLVKNADGQTFELVSKSGQHLYYDQASSRFYAGGQNGNLKLYVTGNEGKMPAWELEIANGQCMNQWEGAGTGRELGVYYKNDGNNPLEFVSIESARAMENLKKQVDQMASYRLCLGTAWNQYQDKDNQFAQAYDAAKKISAYNNEQISVISADDIQSFEKALQNAFGALKINVPTAGAYFRIKNVESGKYISSRNKGNETITLVDDTEGQEVFFLSADGKLTGANHLNLGGGQFSSQEGSSWNIQASDIVGSYQIADPSGKVLGEQDGKLILGDKNSKTTSWQLETVKPEMQPAIEVTLHSGMGTLIAPVALKKPTDVKAYTAKVNKEQKYLILEELSDEVIPAGVAVLIEGNDDSYSFAYAPESDIKIGQNDLKGVYVPTDKSATANTFTLQQPDGHELGFYRYQGEQLNAFKAYIELTSMPSFIRLYKNTTGIDGIQADKNNTNLVFDLSGKAVHKLVKENVYIINGQKVLVK